MNCMHFWMSWKDDDRQSKEELLREDAGMNWIISSSVLILVIIIIRHIFKGKIRLRLQYALWLLVAIRLLVPFSFGTSIWSVEHLIIKVQEQPWLQQAVGEAGLVETVTKESLVKMPTEFEEKQPISMMQAEVQKAEPIKTEVEIAITVENTDAEVAKMPVTSEKVKQSEKTIKTFGWEDLKKVLPYIWAVGAVALGILFFTVNLIFARRVKRSSKEIRVGYTSLPLYVSSVPETPCLYGLSHARIYVTPSVAEDEILLRHCVYHEMTHYRQGDLFWSLVRCVCLVLHWYNPLVWWAYVLSKRDSELACDEGTIRRLGEQERKEYGRTLIQLTSRKPQSIFVANMTMSSGKKCIKERVRLIGRKPRCRIYAMVLVLGLSVTTVGCTFTKAEVKQGRQETAQVVANDTSVECLQSKQSNCVERYDDRGRRIIRVYDPYGLIDRIWLLGNQVIQSFNAQSKDYIVKVVGVGNYDIQEVVNTPDCPDVFLTWDWTEIVAHQEQGYLADLTPYLETSRVLSKEDLRQKALDQFTMDGGLYALPQYCNMESLVVPESQLGGYNDWTVDTFLDWLENSPNVAVTNSLSKELILEYCLKGSLDSYVDTDLGVVNLTGDGFGKLLTDIRELQLDEIKDDNAYWEEGNTYLITDWLYGADLIANLEGLYEDRIVPVGFPSEDGDGKTYLRCISNIAVMANSSCKEGAFSFIEFCLNYKEPYLRECDGRLWTLETKNTNYVTLPYEYETGYRRDPEDKEGKRYVVRITEEHEKMIDVLFEETLIDTYEEAQIRAIMIEGAKSYFAGEESLDKVCSELQKEVNDFLKERG